MSEKTKNLILVISYTVVGIIIYAAGAWCITEKWYAAVIAGVIIAVVGALIGYFYLKSSFAKDTTPKEEPKENQELKTE